MNLNSTPGSVVPGTANRTKTTRFPDRRAQRRLAIVLLFLLTLQLANTLYGKRLWLNMTDSEPVGLYKLERVGGHIGRGELVIMRVPEKFRPYVYGRRWLPEGWSLFKTVGGIAGDSYCVSDSLLTINGSPVGPIYRVDQAGLPLPRLRGCGKVPAGSFLPVATRVPHSFDGRYMGPVDLSEIEGIARPLFTY